MGMERDRLIQIEYDKILASVVGGRLFGEYVLTPKELVVAAYYLGRFAQRQQLDEERTEILNLFRTN
jgi:hypothetical protein